MPQVSVIIPTYNCVHYLKDSITSVLNQSYGDFELIIVDDGSTDNTEAIIKTYSGDPRVKYIKKHNRVGLSAARNTGIKIAQGELIVFLDADDIFLEDKILKQVRLFKKKRLCKICYTNELYFKEGKKKEMLSNRYHFSGDVFYYLKRSNFIHISTVMVKKKILEEYLFDEHLHSHEDWELFLRIAYKNIDFLYIKDTLSKIRIRQDSMTINKDTMNTSRTEVGMRAKIYWGDFKKCMQPFSLRGQKTILRYIKIKTKAFFIGFPKSNRFNRPVPQELL